MRRSPTTTNRTPVTVLGLGAMGNALTTALLRAGHSATVWNRTAGKADRLVAQGATRAESPASRCSREHVGPRLCHRLRRRPGRPRRRRRRCLAARTGESHNPVALDDVAREVRDRTYPAGPAALPEHARVLDQLVSLRQGSGMDDAHLTYVNGLVRKLIANGRDGGGSAGDGFTRLIEELTGSGR